MQNSLFEQRLENLKTVLDSNSQAVLLTNEKNIGYFCGFFHSEGYLLVTENEKAVGEAHRDGRSAAAFGAVAEAADGRPPLCQHDAGAARSAER